MKNLLRVSGSVFFWNSQSSVLIFQLHDLIFYACDPPSQPADIWLQFEAMFQACFVTKFMMFLADVTEELTCLFGILWISVMQRYQVNK